MNPQRYSPAGGAYRYCRSRRRGTVRWKCSKSSASFSAPAQLYSNTRTYPKRRRSFWRAAGRHL